MILEQADEPSLERLGKAVKATKLASKLTLHLYFYRLIFSLYMLFLMLIVILYALAQQLSNTIL